MEKEKLLTEPSFEGIFILFFLFSLTLGLGIIVGLEATKLFQLEEIQPAPFSFWEFLLYFILALFIVLGISFLGNKLRNKKRALFKTMFLTATGLGALISLGTLIGDLAIPLVLILLFLWLKNPSVLLQNILVVLGIAGTGSYLGLRLAPLGAVFLLVFVSIYDYFAVYITKHMVKMAKEMIEEGAVLGLILPQRLSDLRASIKEVVPGGERFFVLGGGDLAFPLLFCCSLLSQGLGDCLIVAFFSLVGLGFTFLIFSRQKTRQPIPALPPIALFSLIGFLVTLFIDIIQTIYVI